MSVIQKILVLMEKEKVNARKLTTDLGLSNSCITEWKKGKAKPSIEAVVKIAGYFGVTTDYLLTDSPEAERKGPERERNPARSDRPQDQTEKEGIYGIGELEEEGEFEPEEVRPGRETFSGPAGETSFETGNVMRRIYRERGRGRQESAGYPAELSGEDRKLLDCYHRLDEEDREYIWCKMIVLEREAMD